MLPIIQTFQSNFVSAYRKQYNANHTVHIILLLPRNFFFSSSILDLLVHTNKSNRELEKKKILDNNTIVCIVFIDLSKVFDCIWLWLQSGLSYFFIFIPEASKTIRKH